MSRHEFSIAYTGATRKDDHSIDVEALAPALLAFGRLLRQANAEFNGKKATTKVLVVSDFEHKCFNVNFELVVGLYEQIKTLLGSDAAKSAKEILEWVGIVAPPGMVFTSFLGYLKWKRGRKVQNVAPLTDSDSTGIVRVQVEGDGNAIHVHNTIYKLSENPKALRATRDAFLPLGKDGFDTVEIRQGDVVTGQIDPEEVDAIVASCNTGIDESQELDDPEIEETPAWLSVYSPVYDVKAPSWRFRFGKDIIYADISETTIAQEALARGGALADDTYQVRLQITTETDAAGKPKSPTYKIVEVMRFVPARPQLRQAGLLDDN